jgi:protein O-mannosyl-transferase
MNMSRRASNAILVVILLACTIAVYFPVRQFQFVNWDDTDMVVANPLLHPPTSNHLEQIWTHPHLGLYTPLSYTLWWCVARVAGDGSDPAMYHVLNLILHAAAALLAFSIIRRFVDSAWPALAGAMIFALHPMQVESVAWIAQMNNLLAGTLSLAAIRLYFLYADSTGRRRRLWYTAATLAFLLALFAKPTAVVVPLIVIVLDVGMARRPLRRVIRSSWLWICLAIAFAIVARSAQTVHGGPFWRRPFIALDALGFYFREIFWLAHLTLDNARTPPRVWESGQWIMNALAIVVLAALIWPTARRSRQPAIAAAIAIAALLPVLGLIPFTQQIYSTTADRYAYLAMLGPAIFIAWLLTRVPQTWAMVLALVFICPLIWLTSRQLPAWQNTGTLADHILQLDTASTIGNKIKAVELAQTGHPDQAIGYYRAAMIRNPEDPDLHFNLANALVATGDYTSAISEYQSIRNCSTDLQLRGMNNLGVAYAKSGRADLAAWEFNQVLQIDPQNQEAARNLQILARGVPSR